MSAPIPHFLRRAWRLIEARRALVEGQPVRALEELRDPALSISPQADRLRQRAMAALYRDAARRAAEGRSGSVARLLGVVAAEDPRRAAEWRTVLAPEPPRKESSVAGLKDLLAGLRRAAHSAGAPSEDALPAAGRPEGAPSGSPGAAPDPAPSRPSTGERPSRRRPSGPAPALQATPISGPADTRHAGSPPRFHLAIDDGGELFVVSGEAITVGHAQVGRADIPLIADLESLHARFVQRVSFHGGASWALVPVGDAQLVVSGRRVSAEGEGLVDGDEIRLAPRVVLRFRAPDPASSSVLLELEGGLEAEGARRVLLLSEGPGGRVRIGPHENRHVPVAGLDHGVALTRIGGELRVECGGGVRLLGAASDGGPGLEVRLPCPPPERQDLLCGARPTERVPFGLSLAPSDAAGPAGGAR